MDSKHIKKELDPDVFNYIPVGKNINYQFIHYEKLDEGSFKSVFNVNIANKEEMLKWKRDFEIKSHSTFTFRRTKNFTNSNWKTKYFLTCHHNVQRGKIGINRHTGCESKMSMFLRKNISRGCFVNIFWKHNHPVHTSASLKLLKVGSETDSKLKELFIQGHSPASAHHCIEFDIINQLQDDEIIEDHLSNRSINPDYKHCHYIYKKFNETEYKDNFFHNKQLKNYIDDLNKKLNKKSITFKEINSELVVGICTPFMARCHENLPEAKELVYIDSSGGFDKKAWKVILFMTYSEAGAMPLGIGLSTSPSMECFAELYNLINNIFPLKKFYGRNNTGPYNFITEDVYEEQEALRAIWPESSIFINQFHILQSVWKWLGSNSIDINDKTSLYQICKDLLYASSIEVLSDKYYKFENLYIIQKYPHYWKYLELLLERKEQWCVAYQHNKILRNHETNHYIEAAMCFVKDKIFHRMKAFNLIQMIHFLSCQLSDYFSKRMINFANNKVNYFFKGFPKYENQLIYEIESGIFQVESINVLGSFYTVDFTTKTCNCSHGAEGTLCKHIYYVYNFFLKNTNVNIEDRKLMYFIGYGFKPSNEWSKLDNNDSNNPLIENVSVVEENKIFDKIVDVNKPINEIHELIDQVIGIPSKKKPEVYLNSLNSFISTLKNLNSETDVHSFLNRTCQEINIGNSEKNLIVQNVNNLNQGALVFLSNALLLTTCKTEV